MKKIQAGYKVQPLHEFLHTAAARLRSPTWTGQSRSRQTQQTSLDFFNQMAFLLQFCVPPHPSEASCVIRFAKIGIEPGKPFDPSSFSPEIQDALKAGIDDGQKAIDAKRASTGGKTDTLFGSREYLKNDFLARATGTQMGIGANSRDEALYPILDKDADGQPLDGSKDKYTMHFAKGSSRP